MRRSLIATALAATLLLAGCSNGSQPGPGAAGTTPASTSSPAGGTGSPGASSPGATAVSPKPGGSPTGGTIAPTVSPTLPATLDKTCVQRGVAADRQGLTVQTKKDAGVVYLTMYSDGSSASSNPALASGGAGAGEADAGGRYRVSWVVPAAAPLGEANLVVASGGAGARLPFVVVEAGQPCP